MNAEKRDRMIAKLRKIADMARRHPGEAEGLAAAERMQALMAEYEITAADLEDAGSAVDGEGVDLGSRSQWKRDIASAVAPFTGCAFTWTVGTKYGTFYGVPGHRVAAKYLTDVLIASVRRELARYQQTDWLYMLARKGQRHTLTTAFCNGCALRLAVRLHEMKMRDDYRKARAECGGETPEASTGSVAMVLKSRVDAAVEASGATPHKGADRSVSREGLAAGSRIPIHRGVDGTGAETQLLA